MRLNNRTLLIAISGVLIVVIVFIFLIAKRSSSPHVIEPPPTNTPPPETLPTSTQPTEKPPVQPPPPKQLPRKEMQLRALSQDQIFDYWIVSSTGAVFTISPLGSVYEITGTEINLVSSQAIQALNFITPSTDGSSILAAFGDPRAPRWGIFDALDKVWRPLPSQILYAAWGASTNQIFALLNNSGVTDLVQADISRTPPRYTTLISRFGLRDVDILFRPKSSLIFTERPTYLYPGSIWELNFSAKKPQFRLLFAPQNGLMAKYGNYNDSLFTFASPSSFSILTFSFQRLASTFLTTLPPKCSDSSSFVFCFAPQNIPQGTHLPDDYLQRRISFQDNLYAIDLQSENVERILASNEDTTPSIDAHHVHYFNGNLYFLNRQDNLLYEIILPDRFLPLPLGEGVENSTPTSTPKR